MGNNKSKLKPVTAQSAPMIPAIFELRCVCCVFTCKCLAFCIVRRRYYRQLSLLNLVAGIVIKFLEIGRILLVGPNGTTVRMIEPVTVIGGV